MKHTKHALVALVAASTMFAAHGAFADDSATDASGSIVVQTGSTENSAGYWETRKIEAQKRSTEMRLKKIEEMKSKGMDVSSISSDLLDASKTSETDFWKAVTAIFNAHEIESRKAFLEKLKANGTDVSAFTDDVIADGQKFWDLVRKTQNAGNASMSGMTNVPPPRPENRRFGSGSDSERPPMEHPVFASGANYGSGSERQEIRQDRQEIRQERRALNERAKNLLVKRLNAIPDVKKAAAYERMKKNVTRQMEYAQKKGYKLVYLKLSETLRIIEDTIGPDQANDEDSALIDSVTSDSTTTDTTTGATSGESVSQ